MDSKECTEIIRRHPELILISNFPVTWEGMLTIPLNVIDRKKIRLKLTVPNFPQFKDADLKFGKSYGEFHVNQFKTQSRRLLQNSFSISSFLTKLQLLVRDTFYDNAPSLSQVIDNSVITELQAVMRLPCDVRLSSTHGLNVIRLVSNGISVELQRDVDSSIWKIVSSDLPQSHGYELIVGTSNSLHDVANKLIHEVQQLEDVWKQLENIDRNCWVIDPLKPKPYHLYRRIKITTTLSILINVDPAQPTALPDIRILGSDSVVAKYQRMVTKNLELWDTDDNLSDNIRLLLELNEFPRASVSNGIEKKLDGLTSDEECCICFSLELAENELPDIICNNEKCRRYFHKSCLLLWLQAVTSDQMTFNQVYGVCPHCSENISCPAE